ncbi:flagellar biosynthesis protein FlhB [Fodinicurvata fenggangensis]|uniref:flagellar biosynthesis protein FlhB n=1 Tax=Fodinicurvata fenggangensis TaxID=1121830 RepID=UPI00047D7F46|nr:flagellar biosynthesis protein FlhB [Fodinicurvata fenggangensis]
MAEEQKDDAQKTEEPTPKRLQDAREKGQVARSQEVNHWFIILGFALVLGIMSPWMVNQIGLALLPFIERPHDFMVESDTARTLMYNTVKDVGLALALPFLVLMLLALASGFMQFGLIFSFESMKPKLSKLSLVSGFKKIYGSRALMEFLKGVLKITLIGVVIAAVIWPEGQKIINLSDLQPQEILVFLRAEALRLLVAVLAVMTVIAAMDFAYQRYKHIKEMRMTRQEVRDETKQSEGDPLVKSRLRQIRMERAKRRMMAAVPSADVVVTNPTHYSIALKYNSDEMNAPTVVAKGIDEVALRIREVARQNEVPLVENRPLARALYDAVEIDEEVPPEHYKAVAEIIGYVMRIRGQISGRGGATQS